MSNLEPTDVGPAAGGDRPVAEADRQHVLSLLISAHAEGILTASERDRRLAEARAAQTFDDLVPLTRDLVSSRPSVSYDVANASTDTDQVFAIFGAAARSGQWRMHPDTNVTAVFGGVELDLRDAIFESNELRISVNCMFGGVKVTVPEGTEVISHVVAAFGGTDTRKLAAPHPGLPRVVITGFVLFGGLEVGHKGQRQGGYGVPGGIDAYVDRDQIRAEAHVARDQLRAGLHEQRDAIRAGRHERRDAIRDARHAARSHRRDRG